MCTLPWTFSIDAPPLDCMAYRRYSPSWKVLYWPTVSLYHTFDIQITMTYSILPHVPGSQVCIRVASPDSLWLCCKESASWREICRSQWMKPVSEERIVDGLLSSCRLDSYLLLAHNRWHCLSLRPIPIRNTELVRGIQPLGLVRSPSVAINDLLNPLRKLLLI